MKIKEYQSQNGSGFFFKTSYPNMKIKKHFSNISFCICIFLNGCSNPVNPEVSIEKISLDKVDNKNLSQFISEIDYVVLEHPNQAFVQVDKLFVVDGKLILVDLFGAQSILSFERNGDFINSVGKLGDGPEEYLNSIDVTFSKRENLIEILSTGGVKQYSPDGKFISNFELNPRPHKFLKIDSSRYVFFVPQVMASELRGGFSKDILFRFDLNSKMLTPILGPIFPEVLNFMGDKNNLYSYKEQMVFSSSFCDTLYLFSSNSEKMKIHLDFGNDQIDLSKLYNLSAYQLVEKLKEEEIRQKAIHIPHLFFNEKYLTSSFLKEREFHFFIHDLQGKVTYLSSRLVNDIDSGPGLGIIKMMDQEHIYSVFEPEELIQHAQNFGENNVNKEDHFRHLIDQLNGNEFLILAKYKLK